MCHAELQNQRFRHERELNHSREEPNPKSQSSYKCYEPVFLSCQVMSKLNACRYAEIHATPAMPNATMALKMLMQKGIEGIQGIEGVRVSGYHHLLFFCASSKALTCFASSTQKSRPFAMAFATFNELDCYTGLKRLHLRRAPQAGLVAPDSADGLYLMTLSSVQQVSKILWSSEMSNLPTPEVATASRYSSGSKLAQTYTRDIISCRLLAILNRDPRTFLHKILDFGRVEGVRCGRFTGLGSNLSCS
jgi:hypothetical protein